MKLSRVVFGATLAVAAAAMPASAQTSFTYSTRGCFGSSCSVNAASALQASFYENPGSLYFTGVNGVVVGPTNGNGYVAATNFGAFTFSSPNSGSNFDNLPEDLTFKLFIAITSPQAANTTFEAEINGLLKKNSSTGLLDVNFDQNFSGPLTYAPNGSYRVFVNDIDTNLPDDDDDHITTTSSYTLGGAFDCSPSQNGNKYTATSTAGAGCVSSGSPNVSSVVPEPSTYALMGAGLLGIFGVSRRRRQA